MSAAHDDTIQRILGMNPGIRFGVPDAFYGNRPIYITDGAAQDARVAARAWLMDPEGFSGRAQDFAGWNLTPTPTDKSVFGEPWLLPAATGPGNSPLDVVGSWGYADGGAVAYWWDVLRAGYLVPNVANPTAPLPPLWAIALSPYTIADFHVGATPATTSTTPSTTPSGTTSSGGTTPGTTTTQPRTAAGTPITGNAGDRFLVGGVTYDGLGHIISTNATGSTSAHSDSSHSVSWLPVALVAAGAYALTRAHSSRR